MRVLFLIILVAGKMSFGASTQQGSSPKQVFHIEATELNQPLVQLVKYGQIACLGEEEAFCEGVVSLKDVISKSIPYKYKDEKKLPSGLDSKIGSALLSISWQDFMMMGSAMHWARLWCINRFLPRRIQQAW